MFEDLLRPICIFQLSMLNRTEMCGEFEKVKIFHRKNVRD
jgi:hypothetical protein